MTHNATPNSPLTILIPQFGPGIAQPFIQCPASEAPWQVSLKQTLPRTHKQRALTVPARTEHTKQPNGVQVMGRPCTGTHT